MNTTEHMAAWQAQQEKRVFAASALAAKHPHLVSVLGNDDLNTAAKNIRIELKAAFPAVKFSVKSKRFSGGDDINVSWIDGPTTRQVDAIIQRYREGTFDGMTDCYEYERSAWTYAFGSSKYLFAYRDHSDAVIETLLKQTADHLKGLDREPTVEMYRKGALWQVKQSGGCDFEREFKNRLSQFSC
jgi:hypothetical protein